MCGQVFALALVMQIFINEKLHLCTRILSYKVDKQQGMPSGMLHPFIVTDAIHRLPDLFVQISTHVALE